MSLCSRSGASSAYELAGPRRGAGQRVHELFLRAVFAWQRRLARQRFAPARAPPQPTFDGWQGHVTDHDIDGHIGDCPAYHQPDDCSAPPAWDPSTSA